MSKLLKTCLPRLLTVAATLLVCVITPGCGFPGGTPPGAVIGRYGVYDYSPSVIMSGKVEYFWWCGKATNPSEHSQNSDTILYETIDQSTGGKSGPIVVMGETPGSWDAKFVCNPKVIKGNFRNPLGDGITYTFAMYYVGTANGLNNSIGVAFSLDGVHWKKFPTPVIAFSPLSGDGYGPAQPVPYNSDHDSSVWLFYEDSASPINHHTKAISSDGVHFVIVGTLTTNGMDVANPNASWGDMAYDAATQQWFAVFNLANRAPATAGGVVERISHGVQLYRISGSSLLTGSTPWQLLKTIDTNSTGYETNFIAALGKDPYGNLNLGEGNTVQLYPSFSNPRPAWNASPARAAASTHETTWDVAYATWSPKDSQLLALDRYSNGMIHEVTTGWIDPTAGFNLESVLGHLYQAPQQSASRPLYACKDGSTDYFTSLESDCEGNRILGLNGYLFPQPVQGMKLVAIFRCATKNDHFVSTDPNCEGQIVEMPLGYILP